MNDLAHAEPVRLLRDIPKLNLDEEQWTNRVRNTSAVFAQFPEVRSSAVYLEGHAGGSYLVNSEGSEVRVPEKVFTLDIRALSQAPDGMTVRDSVSFNALDPSALPGEADLKNAATTVANNISALLKAPRGEDYNGPVIFEGVAAAQIFAEVLGKNLGLSRRPVAAPGGRGGGGNLSELEGRLGARVLPDSFTVVDDPSLSEYRGHRMIGGYEIDREGVRAKTLTVVEKGLLRGYLLPVSRLEDLKGPTAARVCRQRWVRMRRTSAI